MIKVKTCVQCGTSFTAGKGGERHGNAITCSKECAKKRKAEYMREYMHTWHEAHPEYMRAWCEANPEKNREKALRHYYKAGGRDYQQCWPLLRVLDGDACTWCGGLIDFTSRKNFDVDHWKPVSKGGTSEIDNLDLMHKSCNQSKGDTWPLPPLVRGKKTPKQLAITFTT